MSAHHYFRDFAYCDSGMIPWLLVLEILCKSGKPLSELVNERIRLFPASGEINRRLRDPSSAIRKVGETFKPDALVIDATDGLSMEFADWRFNLRCSNTEPVLRLNVEARGSVALMEEKTKEILQMIDLFS
jgi:phosphomannomutase/phosphomannomutase/phosphoglucomutase